MNTTKRAERIRRAILTNAQTRIYRARAEGRHVDAERIAAAVHTLAARTV